MGVTSFYNFYKKELFFIDNHIVYILHYILDNLKAEFKNSYLLKKFGFPNIQIADSQILSKKLKYFDIYCLEGWFDSEKEFIYLNPLFYSERNISYDSVKLTLYHELVHYLQKKTGYYLFSPAFLNFLLYLMNFLYNKNKNEKTLIKNLLKKLKVMLKLHI